MRSVAGARARTKNAGVKTGTAPRKSNEEGRGMRHPWIDGKWMAGRDRGHQGMAREEGHKE